MAQELIDETAAVPLEEQPIEDVDVLALLNADDDVALTCATASDPDRTFSQCLCHWLVLFWMPSPDRKMYSFEVESEICEFAADTLQQQVLTLADDL